ncbi:UDP-N-acetylmuramoyl-L-alanyl-D-glutamate--2,6-diaminopimelate ligase [Roseinatronobacter alkalisoli]|uniref:UDP-N-acetylmuramoyl-L-alanyl-D-glutamate--2,6-diaminopimelate ligase n=1 Tax=Roseinatronobacter alkalisoli TaxID=3028235 RepID=A0ABT5T961_9RHOB|nr:UDP-N-acetylmuramoyl-L-alanyl-D-glutamate--2,6-diaminopimelate ligase [Roseinatronobacter sp. HJB301]MDD7970712.1 UDP-N-acetylmuramoyl-L-alanyl-D-glutamate--2,6-diaminopimelate ligase [Roseinatronobacter sp. HJB301]
MSDHPPRPLSALGLSPTRGSNVTVSGLALDSRQVRQGALFAALPGSRVHGGEFISYALRMGAGAILTDREGAAIAQDALAGSDVALVLAEDPRAAFALACALWFGSQPVEMVAVTGTNGKTSVASFTRQIWALLGHEAVNLGTTGVEGSYSAPLAHTTPDPITLHRLLAEMAQAGVTHAAMEASSHGLDQRRLDGVRLRAAAFTNLTQDHLDYHGTMDAYFAAKAQLFDRLLPDDGVAVINMDDPRGAEILAIAEARGQGTLTVGRSRDADIVLLGQRFEAAGQTMRYSYAGQTYQEHLPLIGGFQAENVLAAVGLVLACGDDPDEVAMRLSRLDGVRGRMQLAGTRANGAPVFVDYSHTPAALEVALQALRPHVMGRLIVVFGAGGDRDKGKRPLMGKAAAENADIVYVTDDNPRSENPAQIRAEVLHGCPDAHEVPDRAEAILRAVDALGPGDALLVAGKGHETGQIVGDTVYPFDDVEQASVAIAALEARA